MNYRKDFIESVGVILGTILVVIIALALIFVIAGLVWWGIGSFIIWVLGINYVWTFWHGLVVAIILNVLSSIFGTTIKKED